MTSYLLHNTPDLSRCSCLPVRTTPTPPSETSATTTSQTNSTAYFVVGMDSSKLIHRFTHPCLTMKSAVKSCSSPPKFGVDSKTKSTFPRIFVSNPSRFWIDTFATKIPSNPPTTTGPMGFLEVHLDCSTEVKDGIAHGAGYGGIVLVVRPFCAAELGGHPDSMFVRCLLEDDVPTILL